MSGCPLACLLVILYGNMRIEMCTLGDGVVLCANEQTFSLKKRAGVVAGRT